MIEAVVEHAAAGENWAGGALTCENPNVEREHARRHQGSELPLRALLFGGSIVLRPLGQGQLHRQAGLLRKARSSEPVDS